MPQRKPEPERVPIAEALPGIQLHKIDDAETIDFVFALVKYRDAEATDGGSNFTTWAYLTSSPPNREELLGALTIQTAILKKELEDEWADDDE